jgi:hypothetical protein
LPAWQIPCFWVLWLFSFTVFCFFSNISLPSYLPPSLHQVNIQTGA